jgi:hypothetical protein
MNAPHLESKIQLQRELDDSAIAGSENLSKRCRLPANDRQIPIPLSHQASAKNSLT